jgi:hypothetical protein
MGRKPKIPIQSMDDIISEPRPMNPPSMSGGSVCVVCKKEIDKCCVEGGGIVKKIKKATKATGKYITDTGGLSSDLLNFGLPAATAAILAAPATAVGGPAAGVAASALGSKLGTLAADRIAKETVLENRMGEGLGVKPKRKSRFVKGSQESKDYMASLRAKKGKKE